MKGNTGLEAVCAPLCPGSTTRSVVLCGLRKPEVPVGRRYSLNSYLSGFRGGNVTHPVPGTRETATLAESEKTEGKALLQGSLLHCLPLEGRNSHMTCLGFSIWNLKAAPAICTLRLAQQGRLCLGSTAAADSSHFHSCVA